MPSQLIHSFPQGSLRCPIDRNAESQTTLITKSVAKLASNAIHATPAKNCTLNATNYAAQNAHTVQTEATFW